ncbi:DUF7835 family putative zinc beta-ribbon protein [Haloarchaeobius baliensis]|uniref:DUF7835 family putative zinc beta-ribbon protein n=1 Tax=Haloarchaeobius baliensis TaxID=1670458 RepID=UPI003F883E0D
MATTDNSIDGRTEHCDSCGTDTIHQVSVQLVTESTKKENSQFSREPYRVTECQQCGTRESQRMNNA